MRVALFGGSFDPPHRGHLAVAHAAAAAFALDTVLFAPTGLQPLKPGGAHAAFADRLAMVRLLCGDDGGLEASEVDAPSVEGTPNYAVDTLRRLRAELPRETTLFAIAGADSFLSLRRWHDPEGLVGAAEWIVVSRPGFSLAELAPLGLSAAQMAKVHLLEGVAEPASATLVRDCLRERGDCSAMLTGPVLEYIRAHDLYR